MSLEAEFFPPNRRGLKLNKFRDPEWGAILDASKKLYDAASHRYYIHIMIQSSNIIGWPRSRCNDLSSHGSNTRHVSNTDIGKRRHSVETFVRALSAYSVGLIERGISRPNQFDNTHGTES